MQKKRCSARRGPFQRRPLSYLSPSNFVVCSSICNAFSSSLDLPDPSQRDANDSMSHQVAFYLFCQHIIFRSCYARCSHLHGILAVEVVHRGSIQALFSLPKSHHSCSFYILQADVYGGSFVPKQFHIFEFQYFFA